jgi:hypothetical protein
MKSKIVEENYNKETGSAFLSKVYPSGMIYSASTKCDECDKDIMNQWDAFRFCEIKCDLQYLNQQAKDMYQRYLGAKHLRDVVVEMQGAIGEDGIKAIDRQVALAKRDYKNLREQYNNSKQLYNQVTENCLAYRRKLRERQTQ